MRRHLLAAGPPLLIAGVIFLLSAQRQLPGPAIPHLDKVAHATVFGLLAFFSVRALALYGWRPGRAMAAGWLVAVLYGASDELHQWFVPGRSTDHRDLLADALGAISAVLLWRWWQRRRVQPSGT